MPTTTIPAAASEGLTKFLEDVSAIVTSGMTWLQTVWTQISADPVLLALVVGLPLVGVGIGLLSRLIRV